MSDNNHFDLFGEVRAFIDEAASFTSHPASLIDQIKQPSNTFSFLDEPDPRGRNDGTFFMEPKQYQNTRWVDWPAPFHLDGNTHAFADGHAVFRRFEDPRTVEIKSFYFNAGPNSADLQYFLDRYNPGDTQH